MRIILSENQTKRLVNNITEQDVLGQVYNKIKNYFSGDSEPETDSGSCSTGLTKDCKDWKQLYDKLLNSKLIKNGEPMLIVWGPSQTMYYTQNGKTLTKQIRVSTGAKGFSNNQDSGSTGTGLMKVSNKFKAPRKYQVLVSKTPVNLVLGPDMPGTRKDPKTGETHVADVLTGILELSGLEECNKNIYNRSIYVHGTNKEKSLGSAHSNGCIRVSNDNILYLLNSVKIGTKLYVRP
jgi:hypothetical protein